MPKKIALAAIGSDVQPVIALGQSLKTRGFEPILAVPKSNIEKAARAGLRAEAIFPSFEEMGAMLGMSEQEATARMLRNPDFLIRRLMIRYLRDSAKALDAISQGASAIAPTSFVFAAPIIAAARNIPLIPVILQPMIMMSPYDPPMTLLDHAAAARHSGQGEVEPFLPRCHRPRTAPPLCAPDRRCTA
jgi:UDP:flavonoid glycosyltransferase YjiC (YdhE family)